MSDQLALDLPRQSTPIWWKIDHPCQQKGRLLTLKWSLKRKSMLLKYDVIEHSSVVCETFWPQLVFIIVWWNDSKEDYFVLTISFILLTVEFCITASLVSMIIMLSFIIGNKISVTFSYCIMAIPRILKSLSYVLLASSIAVCIVVQILQGRL